MKFALAAACAPCVVASSSRAEVTPIQKVIDMMTQMKLKAEEEKHQETVRFTGFSQWCKDTETEKNEEIKSGADDITQLEADISKADADVAKLGEEISGLDASVDGWSNEEAAAKAERAQSHAEYKSAHKDYTESIDAITRAVVVLKERSKDTPQKQEDSLLEVKKVADLPRVSQQAKYALTAFLQSKSDVAAPEANAYEFQSGSVVDMLEKIKLQFEDEKGQLEKEEMSRKAAFEMMMQNIHDNVFEAEKTRSEKAALKGQRTEDSAEANGDLVATQKAKTEDEAFLQDTVNTCAQTSKDYEQRQQTRKEEIEAILKAIEIISSPNVSGAGDKHLPSLIQQSQGKPRSSFSQLRSSSSDIPRNQMKVAEFLMERARNSKSELLEAMSARVSADPFAKVKQMIKDLLVKLIKEAGEEADHKAWCDEELATNKQTRDDKSQMVEDLTAKIDELTALEAKLTEAIADLGDAVSALTTSMKERTTDRQEEKAENEKTIAESQQASAAVSMAMGVLQSFYAKAAQATALVQQTPAEASAAVFNKPYKGQQGEAGGVMGFLEVIASDFARLTAETKGAESSTQQDYLVFMDEAKADKAAKEKEARHHGFEKTRARHALSTNQKDLEATQAELTAALDYFDKLKPTCIGEEPSYAERKKRREEEIQSLKEALTMFE